jgi:hypothetical protein
MSHMSVSAEFGGKIKTTVCQYMQQMALPHQIAPFQQPIH